MRAWGSLTNRTARSLANWLCALWGRHEGAQGGAPLALVWGARGRALSQPRPLVLSGVRPGPITHWLWVRAVRAWGRVTNPTARTVACWLCALWGRHEGAQGGRLWPGCGASRVGRSLTPDRPSFGACGRGPLPSGWGGGGCRRGDPSPTQQRAYACWLGALSGRHEGALGGAPLACARGVRGRALSHPRPLFLSGMRPGPTTHWLWVRGSGVGTRHQPDSARRCELALRAVGAA